MSSTGRSIDPVKREGKYPRIRRLLPNTDKLGTRIVDLHPMTVMQNARTAGGGNIALVPTRAATVGPKETLKSGKSLDLAGGLVMTMLSACA